MLTGDSHDIAGSISAKLDLDGLISEATPEDKMRAVRRYPKAGSVLHSWVMVLMMHR